MSERCIIICILFPCGSQSSGYRVPMGIEFKSSRADRGYRLRSAVRTINNWPARRIGGLRRSIVETIIYRVALPAGLPSPPLPLPPLPARRLQNVYGVVRASGFARLQIASYIHTPPGSVCAHGGITLERFVPARSSLIPTRISVLRVLPLIPRHSFFALPPSLAGFHGAREEALSPRETTGSAGSPEEE